MNQQTTVQRYSHILVPFDGSPGATNALRRALALAREFGARLSTLSIDEALPRYAPGVGEVDQPEAEERAYYADLCRQAEELADAAGWPVACAGVEGEAVHEILRYAAQHAVDLIAMGQTGHAGLLGTLLGSTTRGVVERSRCDVLVVR